MRYPVIGAAAAVAIALLPTESAMAQLPGLIERNIQSAVKSSRRAIEDPQNAAPQLWIHVRSDAQKREVAQKLDWFKTLQVAGRKVEVEPIQVVSTGPSQSQLRFFKEADQERAQALLAELRKAVPTLALQDLSSQYRQATWIDSGHFELWLAPNVSHLAVP